MSSFQSYNEYLSKQLFVGSNQKTYNLQQTTISNFAAFSKTIVFPGLKWPPFFANYSLMVILIEKLIREMNLDIDHVIELFFST